MELAYSGCILDPVKFHGFEGVRADHGVQTVENFFGCVQLQELVDWSCLRNQMQKVHIIALSEHEPVRCLVLLPVTQSDTLHPHLLQARRRLYATSCRLNRLHLHRCIPCLHFLSDLLFKLALGNRNLPIHFRLDLFTRVTRSRLWIKAPLHKFTLCLPHTRTCMLNELKHSFLLRAD